MKLEMGNTTPENSYEIYSALSMSQTIDEQNLQDDDSIYGKKMVLGVLGLIISALLFLVVSVMIWFSKKQKVFLVIGCIFIICAIILLGFSIGFLTCGISGFYKNLGYYCFFASLCGAILLISIGIALFTCCFKTTILK